MIDWISKMLRFKCYKMGEKILLYAIVLIQFQIFNILNLGHELTLFNTHKNNTVFQMCGDVA